MLNKAEKSVLRMLDEGLTPAQIEHAFLLKFKFGILPPEYDFAAKRACYLWDERNRDVKQEQYQTRHWEENYRHNKAKRH